MSISMPTRRRRAPFRPIEPSPQAAAPTRVSGFDRDYWLTHCEGFRVDSAEGRIGFVEDVRDLGPDAVPLLAIRAGRLGRRLLYVSAADVAFIVPRAARIWLTSPIQLAASEGA